MNSPSRVIFVMPDEDYLSYTDFWSLVRLSGFPIVSISSLTTITKTHTYIVVSPTALAFEKLAPAKRRIAWQLEYSGNYTHNYDSFDGELWASDPHWAEQHNATYVLLGSDVALNPSYRQRKMSSGITYDVTMLGHLTERRQKLKDSLSSLRWTQDYSGVGEERHQLLSRTRLMMHVHQTESRFIAPLRIALAAAYRMPVLSEHFETTTRYDPYISSADYRDIPAEAQKMFATNSALSGEKLHHWLCRQHPFRSCVLQALSASNQSPQPLKRRVRSLFDNLFR